MASELVRPICHSVSVQDLCDSRPTRQEPTHERRTETTEEPAPAPQPAAAAAGSFAGVEAHATQISRALDAGAARLLAAQIGATYGNRHLGRVLQRQETETADALAQLDDLLDDFNVDEEGVITLLTGMSDADKGRVLRGGYRDGIASALDAAEMVRAVRALAAPVDTGLDWVRAAAGGASDIEYAQIRSLITGATDKTPLHTGAWKSFFVDVCDDETIHDAVADLELPLSEALRWLIAEIGTSSLELDDIRDMITTATDAERQALHSDSWRDAFVEICDDVAMSQLVDLLFTTFLDKMRWLAAEEVSWPLLRVRLEIESDPAQRQLVYGDDTVLAGFVAACDNAQMAEAVILIGGTMAQKQVWLEAEGTSTNEYLDAVVRLQVFEPGGIVAHTPAIEADAAIADHLGAMVENARGEGRGIAGHVAVVGDDDWNLAGINHYGATVWATKSLNGFVDGDGRVWIHKDNGDVGTMIHEGLHKHSDEAMIGISQPLNEGVTEYFTRKVCAALSPPFTGRASYTNNYTACVQLAALVGETTLAAAYFDGATDEMQEAFETAKSADDWTSFVRATRANNWATATTLATP
jgi:hypothetical protein